MQKQMDQIGVIHGRFQILHNDHMVYLLAGKERCKHLIIGITNPDPFRTKYEVSDPNRNLPSSNPLNYYQRYQMISAAFDEAGIPYSEYSIVPFPINHPKLYKYYLPLDAVHFLTIYDKWGADKLDKFKQLGLQTKVMWQRNLKDKGINASQVRKLILTDGDWQKLVPDAVAELLKKWEIKEILQKC